MSKTDDSEAEEKQGSSEESAEAEAAPAKIETSSDDRDEGDDDEDDDGEAEREKAPPKREPSRRADAARAKRKAAPAAAAPSVPTSRVALFVLAALAVGGAAGWFGHQEQAKSRLRAESAAAAAPAGSGAPTGSCGAWQSKVCDSAGEESAICAQAKGATDLLTPSTCDAALDVMPATLTKIKAARKSCDSLVGKLCKDLPPGASTCDMVKEKTPAFPSKRCDEMLQHYDEVLASLRDLEQQGGIPGGPGMRPPGALPPGH